MSRTQTNREVRVPFRLLLLLLLITPALVTCDSFVLYEHFNASSSEAEADEELEKDVPETSSGLTLSPVSVVIERNQTIDFGASGGEPEYAFTVTAGGGSIESDTGRYTSPGSAGNATIVVTDAAGATAEASVTTIDSGSTALQISPVSVSIETNQTLMFATNGGVPGYVFSIAGGGGTIVSDTGLYTAPATAGSAIIRVEDSSGAVSDAIVTILDADVSALSVSPATTAVKVNETVAFAASGGQGGYVFSIVNGAGSIDPVSGLFTAPNTAGSTTVRVTDVAAATVEATVIILVSAELRIYPEIVTLNFGGTYTFAATGGTTPYTFTLQNNQSGANIAGATYTAGSAEGIDIVRVSEDGGSQAFASVTVVPTGVLVINPTSPRVEEGASLTFAGAGGTPAYEFSIVSGPGTGSILTSSGVYHAPATVGIGVSEVQLTDSVSGTTSTLVDVVPRAPSNLVADGSQGGPKTIKLTWEDNSTNENGYRIERRTSTGSYVEIFSTGPNVTSYTDNDNTLEPNTLYIYRVYAFTNDPLQSEYSNEAYDLSNS